MEEPSKVSQKFFFFFQRQAKYGIRYKYFTMLSNYLHIEHL